MDITESRTHAALQATPTKREDILAWAEECAALGLFDKGLELADRLLGSRHESTALMIKAQIRCLQGAPDKEVASLLQKAAEKGHPLAKLYTCISAKTPDSAELSSLAKEMPNWDLASYCLLFSPCPEIYGDKPSSKEIETLTNDAKSDFSQYITEKEAAAAAAAAAEAKKRAEQEAKKKEAARKAAEAKAAKEAQKAREKAELEARRKEAARKAAEAKAAKEAQEAREREEQAAREKAEAKQAAKERAAKRAQEAKEKAELAALEAAAAPTRKACTWIACICGLVCLVFLYLAWSPSHGVMTTCAAPFILKLLYSIALILNLIVGLCTLCFGSAVFSCKPKCSPILTSVTFLLFYTFSSFVSRDCIYFHAESGWESLGFCGCLYVTSILGAVIVGCEQWDKWFWPLLHTIITLAVFSFFLYL